MADSTAATWQFWIDVGGTFTDCVARRPDGRIVTHKLLSSGVYKGAAASGSTAMIIADPERRHDPPRFFEGWRITLLHNVRVGSDVRVETLEEDVPVLGFDPASGALHLGRPLRWPPGMTYELRCGEEALITGIRWLMGKRLDEAIGAVEVRLGTTRGTNALLERQGAATALVTTAGFRDVLRIAYQNRPRLFDLEIRKPADLYREVVELDERLDKDGRVLQPLNEAEVCGKLAGLRERGIISLAVCLTNSYRNPAHEQLVERVARELGFEQVSVSSRLSPLQ
ncbi:MAG: hydantoinase, partial [Planctomycetes bacterium]|nr:hydantoinase [Planctomycetota bacterium]